MNINRTMRRLLTATATTVAFAASAAPQALALEPFTPQAIDANATFLSYAPAIPGRPDMKVCVVDTGVDLTTDAAPAVVARETVFPGGAVDDGGGGGLPKHGTYVAGVIASQANNADSVGIWPLAKIVSVRVFREQDAGTTAANYIAALNRCADAGAKVANLSLSGLDTASATELSELENQITSLRAIGMDVVAAAGNSGGPVGYPAAFPAVFAVGASSATRGFCSFSNRGTALDISTLGCGVELTYLTGGVSHAEGTSLAAPVVSGVLAALRYYRPDLTPDDAEQLLLDNATTGAAPRLNAGKAFRAAGLSSIADAPTPPIVAPPDAAASSPPAPSAPTTTVVEVPASAVAPADADPLADLGVRRPKLRSSSYRGGVLSVTVSGVPDFGRAIFTVDKHRYTRGNGKLRVRLIRAPKRVSVLIDVPGVGRTAALPVKIKAPSERTGKR